MQRLNPFCTQSWHRVPRIVAYSFREPLGCRPSPQRWCVCLLREEFHQRVRQHIERRGHPGPVFHDARWHAARAYESQHRLPAFIIQPACGVRVHSGIAILGKEVRIVSPASFRYRAFHITSQTLAEPCRSVTARRKYVRNLVKVRGQTGTHAVCRQADGPSTGRGDRCVISNLQANNSVPCAWQMQKRLHFGDAPGGASGEHPRSRRSERTVIEVHHSASVLRRSPTCIFTRSDDEAFRRLG